jgi:hypothetical protein
LIIVNSVENTPIRLTHERWDHIIRRHPELDSQKERVLETVNKPDFVQEGDLGALLAIRHYLQTPLTTKYLIVVYKEVKKMEGFIITAYFASQPSKRRNIKWKP